MTHKVFISFRGEDTRQGFVSHLHSALKRIGIRAYTDDFDLERGNDISSTLLRAIEESKISLIVFSKNFASSRWTLEELVTIMSCKKTRGQTVIPVFYRISPSEVRKKRSYKAVFNKCLPNLSHSDMKEMKQRWTIAMTEAAGIAGWESSNFRKESELVEAIAKEVQKRLESMSHEGIENCFSRKNCLLLLHGPLNLVGYLGDKATLLRKEHERLILTTRWNLGQPLKLDNTSDYLYRNRYIAKREQLWWGISSTAQANSL